MELGGAAVVSEAIQGVVEDKLRVEEEDMEGRLAVVSKLSRSFRQNSRVANVEDAFHPATKNKLDLNSLKLTEGFPNRPGYGTRGTRVELTANYIELLPPSNLTLHQYDIQISPVAVGKKHFRVVQLLLQAPECASKQGDIATDFRSTLVSKTKLSQDEVLVEVPYRSESEDEPTARATVYKVRVQYSKTLNVGELVNYLNSTSLSQSLVDKQELTQALNIFLNHYAKSAKNLITIGSTKSFSLSSEAARADIGSGLEII
ncbi:Argonaute Dicer PAZ [Fusarium acutatum]|uniref:Argonaute Dicer PAZ n=1 Tax=Fusarium acutatum TaxID=78861 RepID=A0A8H4JBS8_9HYPO|nr:Argonaute Dicer PAZ [Fusarium acutatum]